MLLIINKPHHKGKRTIPKRNGKCAPYQRGKKHSLKETKRKWFAHLHQIFLFSYQCCFWLLCCAFEHRCDAWYSCQTQSANCLCLSGTKSYSFIAVLYFTVGGEIWLPTQGLLCLLGWLFVLNNQYHWDKLNAAFDKGSKHKKNKYMIFFENVLNHCNSCLTFLQKKNTLVCDSKTCPTKSNTKLLLKNHWKSKQYIL